MKMKKAVFYVVVLISASIILGSCNKCYTCAQYGNATEILCEKTSTKAQIDAADTFCIHNGGVWTPYQH